MASEKILIEEVRKPKGVVALMVDCPKKGEYMSDVYCKKCKHCKIAMADYVKCSFEYDIENEKKTIVSF